MTRRPRTRRTPQARRRRPRRQRLAGDHPGPGRHLRRRDRRPPVDPRRRRTRAHRPVRRHHRPRLPHPRAAHPTVDARSCGSRTSAWRSTTASTGSASPPPYPSVRTIRLHARVTDRRGGPRRRTAHGRVHRRDRRAPTSPPWSPRPCTVAVADTQHHLGCAEAAQGEAQLLPGRRHLDRLREHRAGQAGVGDGEQHPLQRLARHELVDRGVPRRCRGPPPAGRSRSRGRAARAGRRMAVGGSRSCGSGEGPPARGGNTVERCGRRGAVQPASLGLVVAGRGCRTRSRRGRSRPRRERVRPDEQFEPGALLAGPPRMSRACGPSGGTGSGRNGRRLLCRRGIAAEQALLQWRRRAGPAGVKPGQQVRVGSVAGAARTASGCPATASASRALNTAAPQAIRTRPAVGSATGSRRAGSARTSIAPSRRRNRQGWLLCSDGAGRPPHRRPGSRRGVSSAAVDHGSITSTTCRSAVGACAAGRRGRDRPMPQPQHQVRVADAAQQPAQLTAGCG